MNASIEPELLAGLPRSITRRPGRGKQQGCVLLFMLPHTLVGLGMFCLALLHLAVLIFGTAVPGTLTGTRLSHGSKGSVTYKAAFQYGIDGATYDGETQISKAEYGLASQGQAITVKVLRGLPGTGEILFIPGGSRWGSDLFIVPFALFWNAFLVLFFTLLLGGMWKEKSLLRRGLAARGRIVDKQILRNKSITYILHYEYAPDATTGLRSSGSVGPWSSASAVQPISAAAVLPVDGTGMLRGKMTVPGPDFDNANVGNEMTVLYDARKPQRSILYAPAAYTVRR